VILFWSSQDNFGVTVLNGKDAFNDWNYLSQILYNTPLHETSGDLKLEQMFRCSSGTDSL
jgi:hypothetical protein